MNSCDIVKSTLTGVTLLVCAVAVFDCTRRIIPPPVVKFRVLIACNTVLNFALALMGGSADVVTGVTLSIVRNAFRWISVFYFFENFLLVVFTLKLGLGKATQKLSIMLSCWKIFKPTIVVAYLILAVVYPFNKTNMLFVANACFSLTSVCVAILPMCATIIHIGFTMRSHRVNLTPDKECSTDQDRAGAARIKEMKHTQWQLWILGGVFSVLSILWIYQSISNIRDARSNLSGAWLLEGCSIGDAVYSRLAPVLIAHFLTRCPHAKSKKTTGASSATLAASSKSATAKDSPRKSVLSGVGNLGDDRGGKGSSDAPNNSNGDVSKDTSDAGGICKETPMTELALNV